MWELDYKVEHQRTDAFELWYCRRLLRVPWTARRSNQSILKEISPKYSLEKMMLKLKLQSFGHLMQRTDSLEKTLMLGKIEGRRRRGRQRTGWLGGITNSRDVNLCKLRERIEDREAGRVAVQGVSRSRTRLRGWTTRKLFQRSSCQSDWLTTCLQDLGQLQAFWKGRYAALTNPATAVLAFLFI